MKNTKTTEKKGIILLSGGLDSLVSLFLAKKECSVVLALNFDYGQIAFREENRAAKKIAEHFDVALETIELPFLKKLYKTGNLDDFKDVWVPNRNGLFINIAAAYCDKFDIDYIIFGANKEEAEQFPDNSLEFIQKTNEVLEFSTLKKPEVLAPCANLAKVDMINLALDFALPLNLIKSCYAKNNHCGKCMSCKLLYNAIMKSRRPELAKEIFK